MGSTRGYMLEQLEDLTIRCDRAEAQNERQKEEIDQLTKANEQQTKEITRLTADVEHERFEKRRLREENARQREALALATAVAEIASAPPIPLPSRKAEDCSNRLINVLTNLNGDVRFVRGSVGRGVQVTMDEALLYVMVIAEAGCTMDEARETLAHLRDGTYGDNPNLKRLLAIRLGESGNTFRQKAEHDYVITQVALAEFETFFIFAETSTNAEMKVQILKSLDFIANKRNNFSTRYDELSQIVLEIFPQDDLLDVLALKRYAQVDYEKPEYLAKVFPPRD